MGFSEGTTLVGTIVGTVVVGDSDVTDGSDEGVGVEKEVDDGVIVPELEVAVVGEGESVTGIVVGGDDVGEFTKKMLDENEKFEDSGIIRVSGLVELFVMLNPKVSVEEGVYEKGGIFIMRSVSFTLVR